MTDHIASGKCILTNVGITLENKTLLRKSNVPEDDGNREECNEIEEAIMDPSSMDMNSSPWRHVSTNGVTAMMTQQATMDLKHQGINLKPYKDLISQK